MGNAMSVPVFLLFPTGNASHPMGNEAFPAHSRAYKRGNGIEKALWTTLIRPWKAFPRDREPGRGSLLVNSEGNQTKAVARRAPPVLFLRRVPVDVLGAVHLIRQSSCRISVRTGRAVEAQGPAIKHFSSLSGLPYRHLDDGEAPRPLGPRGLSGPLSCGWGWIFGRISRTRSARGSVALPTALAD